MSKANFFNKGIVKGKLIKSKIVEWSKNDRKGKFLSMEVDTGRNNRVKVTLFGTKSKPNKHKEIHETYPVGSMVEISGEVEEREFTTQTGAQGIDRSVRAFVVKSLMSEIATNGTFIIQGIVKSVREISGGIQVVVRVDDSYTDKEGNEKVNSKEFTLSADIEMIETFDIVKRANAKFKGYILNKLELDEFGDIVGRSEMFKVAKIDKVISPDELIEEDEELPFD